jgi:hypothetical protein
MTVLLRAASVLFVAIGAFLLYAVVAALTSTEGARPAVAVGYVIGAIVLAFAAFKLWTARGHARVA